MTAAQGIARAYAYEVLTPSRSLSRFVECYWMDHSWRRPRHCLILPDGAPHLIFHVLGNDASAWDGRFDPDRCRLRVIGPRSRALEIDRRDRLISWIVRLRPGWGLGGGGRDFEGMTDRGVDLAELWGERATRLIATLSNASNWNERIVRLERELFGAFEGGESASPWMGLACSHLQGDRSPGIRELALNCGVSERHFRSEFRKRVGMSPKLYARIARLHAAVRLAVQGGGDSLSTLALDAGYCDQAHMNRDFRGLMGVTPLQFLKSLGASPCSRADSSKTVFRPPGE